MTTKNMDGTNGIVALHLGMALDLRNLKKSGIATYWHSELTYREQVIRRHGMRLCFVSILAPPEAGKEIGYATTRLKSLEDLMSLIGG